MEQEILTEAKLAQVETLQVTLSEEEKIVCDEYGVGIVKRVYESDVRGFAETYVEIYFANLKMNYQRPLAKLKYRPIGDPVFIKSLFKVDCRDKIKELLKLNFNLQQNKISDMINHGTVEDVIFVLRFLDVKKRNSVISSLCAFDDLMYRKIQNNLAEEISVASEIEIKEASAEIRKLLEKNKIDIVLPKIDIEDDDEEDFEEDLE
jgi:RNA polymerase-interacting CarD/CdnL/TRCF family regulator